MTKNNLLKILLSAFLLFSLFAATACGKESLKLPHFYLSAELSGDEIKGKSVYKFVNDTDNAFSEVKFNLYANAYREGAKYKPYRTTDSQKVFGGEISYGGTEITGVTVNGEKADYVICGEDENVLSVKTGEIFPDESAEIAIVFKTKIPRAALKLGINGDRINLADFYPSPCAVINGEFKECIYNEFGDPYINAALNCVFELTVPSSYTVAAFSNPVSAQETDGKITYCYELDGARDIALCASENFSVAVKEQGGVEIKYYYEGDGEQAEKGLSLAADCIKFFSEQFGAYPFKTFSVVETDLNAGGMEFSALCFVDVNADEEHKRNAIIHETAHEWWYAAVGGDEVKCAWQDEGLAEYSVYLYLSENGFESEANDVIEGAKSAYKSFFELKDLLSGNADTSMNRPLTSFSGKYEYINIAYNKGLLCFKGYEDAIGRARSITNLKKYYKKYLFKIALPEDMYGCLGLKEHFTSYADGKVII